MKQVTMEEYRRRYFDRSLLTDNEGKLCETEADDCRLPGRKPVSHKYSYGRALIVAGSERAFQVLPRWRQMPANAAEQGLLR